ncbi:MAG: hypothetical protein JWM53_3889 [bacterium]|nr:hypothetical protein [bacterium]
MRRVIAILALVAPLAAGAAEPDPGEVLGRAELPPKVEAAFAREAGAQGLAHIRRLVDARGHVIYSAEIAGTGRKLEVAPDGKLVNAKR